MSAPNTAEYELLTEHLTYPPVSLLDDIINTVNVLADRALDSVERLLLSLPAQNLGFGSKKRSRDADDGSSTHTQPPSPEEAAKREIENGTHQLETLLNTSIDKEFDKFELYVMKNILTVGAPEQAYVRLAHYDGLDFDAAAAADAPTTESVTQLRRRLQASQKLHVALVAERERNEALLKKLRAALGVKQPGSAAGGRAIKKEDGEEGEEGSLPVNSLGFLRDRGTLEQGGSEKPIATTAEFALSQLQPLRSLSTTLRALLPKLEEGGEADDEEEEGDGDGKKTWRRERAEYIESASRRYLETETGLELGPDGEVRDGEWQGSGRGLAKGEVEGMERVVAVLGASRSGETTRKGDEEQEMDES